MQVSNSLTVEKDIYEDFLVSDHITTTAYLRISLPNLLAKEDYKKVLLLRFRCVSARRYRKTI